MIIDIQTNRTLIIQNLCSNHLIFYILTICSINYNNTPAKTNKTTKYFLYIYYILNILLRRKASVSMKNQTAAGQIWSRTKAMIHIKGNSGGGDYWSMKTLSSDSYEFSVSVYDTDLLLSQSSR